MRLLARARRSAVTLTVTASALLAASAVLPAAASPRPTGQLQNEVDAVHRTGTVGVSAEVTSPGRREVARAGTAVQGGNAPMPHDGRFRVGSVTKTFTATVILQLVGEGRIALDDTVDHWLPGIVHGNGNDGRLVTVRQLLQHTSGIPDALPDIPSLADADGYRTQRFRTYAPSQVVALAMRRTPTFPPGRDWSYSNTNYVLAAMIIERATGRTWDHEVTDRIIRPLGLRGTSIPGTSSSVPGPHARSYSTFGDATGPALDVTALDTAMATGSGSIISTTHDLSLFYSALLDGRLIAPAQFDDMTTTVPAPALGVRYGLGIGSIPLLWRHLFRPPRRTPRLPHLGRHHPRWNPDRCRVRNQRGRRGHPGRDEHTCGPGALPRPRRVSRWTKSPYRVAGTWVGPADPSWARATLSPGGSSTVEVPRNGMWAALPQRIRAAGRPVPRSVPDRYHRRKSTSGQSDHAEHSPRERDAASRGGPQS